MSSRAIQDRARPQKQSLIVAEAQITDRRAVSTPLTPLISEIFRGLGTSKKLTESMAEDKQAHAPSLGESIPERDPP